MSKPWPEAPSSPTGAPVELSQQAAALRSVVRALIAHLLRERRDHPDVEDGVNEVFRRALEGHDRIRPGRPVRPWVLGIARHVALDTVRSRGRTFARQARPERDERGELHHPIEGLADPGPGPDSVAERTERARRITAALDALPEQQRKALTLFHVDGLGYREIAAELGVPVGTVGTWINRGRRQLAAALAGDERDDHER